MHQALLFAGLTALATTAGGFVALKTRDRLHLVLGLSAGLLLGLVGFDLLPTDFSLARTWGGVRESSLMLVVGFLVLHLSEKLFATHEPHDSDYGHDHKHLAGPVTGLAMAGHVFLDGMGIGVAFHVSTSLGLAVFFALVVHAFSDGLNTVSFLIHNGRWTNGAKSLLLIDATCRLSGAAVGSYLVFNSSFVSLYLSLFTGFVIYIATSHILPEAHASHASRATMLMTVLGVGAMWIVVAGGA